MEIKEGDICYYVGPGCEDSMYCLVRIVNLSYSINQKQKLFYICNNYSSNTTYPEVIYFEGCRLSRMDLSTLLEKNLL